VHCPREPKSFPHSHAPAFVASHDAPLIGERAGTRGRIAMEGGDEHAGEIELPVRASASRTGSNRVRDSSLADRIGRRKP
jgi:hypothetical protein